MASGYIPASANPFPHPADELELVVAMAFEIGRHSANENNDTKSPGFIAYDRKFKFSEMMRDMEEGQRVELRSMTTGFTYVYILIEQGTYSGEFRAVLVHVGADSPKAIDLPLGYQAQVIIGRGPNESVKVIPGWSR